MRKLSLPGLLLCFALLGAAACWADTITSSLGHPGPAFAPGTMPSTLGWGPEDKPCPDKFVVNPTDGAEMVWVPAGEFMMGSTPGEHDYAYGWAKKLFGDAATREWFSDEGPQHKVRITKGFWLGKCTVTNAQYREFCRETGRVFPQGSTNGPKHPVVLVQWYEAMAYCHHYGLVLPTEAQWEYAARGPEGRRYPWGKEWDPKKCCNGENKGPDDLGTMEVGSLPAGDSWCGASDMAGNVWQWCADWYDDGYYAKSPAEDPTGPERGDRRLLRGGSWSNNPCGCRSAARARLDPVFWGNDSGFRVARTP